MKKELIIVSILTVLIAFMEITGIPAVFLVDVNTSDIEPIYFALMTNFVIIGIIAYFVLKYLCSDWKLGFKKEGLVAGLKKYGVIGVIVAVIGFISFYVGLAPFDLKPSVLKVIIEGIIYHIGVAIIEELYVRGLLLNLIERLCEKRKNKTIIAVMLSSVLFGLGHVFGVLNQSVLVIIIKVIWTVCMGMYFGAVYRKTNNLWVSIIIHFLINVCAIPYCFSSISGYANLTLYIILPTYLLLGIYSFYIMKYEKN